MLRIDTVSQKVAQEALRIADEIARKDRGLAIQLRRAATSIPLNVAEVAGLRGGNGTPRHRERLRDTAGSFRGFVYLGRGARSSCSRFK